ncbi:hypothetical protein CVT26_012417 [Gymnopilus dilepis]|uniref:Uncharacterized protein n=1 Tax=Gymnopilus dilepis TaxID=231916 RepID=A0A409YWF0_9AGAR|nr:hypothetical protein CVT26_012417 [Gymnopilus dilepis]
MVKQQDLIISQALPGNRNPGTADIVGFGPNGVTIVRNRINPQAELASDAFGANSGWRNDRHIRLVADTTGNGAADLVGFADDGVYIAVNKGNNTFEKPKKVVNDFGFAAGNWTVEDHIRYMADIRHTGRADIVGFGNAGVFVSFNNGDGTFSAAKLVTKEFGNDPWKKSMHLRFLADTTGNGHLDIVGFGAANIYVALNNGDGTFQPSKVVLSNFCYDQGWHVDQHPRFLADLTGDGKVDVIGFGTDGVYVSLNKGDGTFLPPKRVIDNFGLNQGWQSDKHVRLVADITGDGRADVVGFGQNGVYVSINNGDGTFQAQKFVLQQFAYDDTWRVEKHLRFLADMTGNGRADIVGFGTNAVYVGYNDGNGGFAKAVVITSGFGSDTDGWSIDKAVKYAANLYH